MIENLIEENPLGSALDALQAERQWQTRALEAIKPPQAMRDLLTATAKREALLIAATKPPKALMDAVESARRREAMLSEALQPLPAVLDLIKSARRREATVANLIKAPQAVIDTSRLIAAKPPKALVEMIESQRRWGQEFEKLRPNPRDFEAATILLHSQPLLSEHFARIVAPAVSSKAQFGKLAATLSALREGMTPPTATTPEPEDKALTIASSGEIVYGGHALDSTLLSETAGRLADKLVEAAIPDEYFRRFSDFFRSLNHPASRCLLSLFFAYVVTVYGNLTTPAYQPWWDSLFPDPRPQVQPELEHTTDDFDKSSADNYAFITTAHVAVIAEDGDDERIVGELPPGKRVRIIATENGCSLIEYRDWSQQKLLRGWVLSASLFQLSE